MPARLDAREVFSSGVFALKSTGRGHFWSDKNGFGMGEWRHDLLSYTGFVEPSESSKNDPSLKV